MAGSGRPLLTLLTRVYIDEKAAYRKAGTQPSMAERRGAGGPPDGHDPEALPHAAPLLAKFLSISVIVRFRFSNRHATFQS